MRDADSASRSSRSSGSRRKTTVGDVTGITAGPEPEVHRDAAAAGPEGPDERYLGCALVALPLKVLCELL